MKVRFDISMSLDGYVAARTRRSRSRSAREECSSTSGRSLSRAFARQYLEAGLVDEFQVHVVPILLGDGVRLFERLETRPEVELVQAIDSPAVAHLRYRVVR